MATSFCPPVDQAFDACVGFARAQARANPTLTAISTVALFALGVAATIVSATVVPVAAFPVVAVTSLMFMASSAHWMMMMVVRDLGTIA